MCIITTLQEQNQPWRAEPEISSERRAELEKCRALVPDVKKGIYPFKGVKLERADVEWLLATHEGGPVKWSDEWRKATEEQRSSAVVLTGGADLSGAQLAGAHLRNVMLGDKQRIGPRLADLQWGDTNLAVVDWSHVAVLGDEHQARQKTTPDGKKKRKALRVSEYQAAVRANRQLAVALQAQGLSEEAARFAYRAQRLQRIVVRRQKKIGQYLFSGLLDLLAGYGYKPGRSVIAYLLLIAGFALTYYSFGHLAWYEALVVSLTAFHGRGFFAQQFQPGDPQAIIAALEAVVGLLIEISFIATFTQRFFGK